MTHGLEGRCSVQLSYGRTSDPALRRRRSRRTIGALGFEPGTSCSRSRRANRAALRPAITTEQGPWTANSGWGGKTSRAQRSPARRNDLSALEPTPPCISAGTTTCTRGGRWLTEVPWGGTVFGSRAHLWEDEMALVERSFLAIRGRKRRGQANPAITDPVESAPEPQHCDPIRTGLLPPRPSR